MGILSLEANDISYTVLQKIRTIFQDWQHVLYQLFKQTLNEQDALKVAKITVADYEGAILMYRLYQDIFYLDQVKKRVLQLL